MTDVTRISVQFPAYFIGTPEGQLVIANVEGHECLVACANLELARRHLAQSSRRLAWQEIADESEYRGLLLSLGNDVPFISWRTTQNRALDRLLRVTDECRRTGT